MKKILLILFTVLTALTATAQRSIKIAYIDMEYILDKVPDYAEAKNQLEQRAQKWKQEIETKKNEINALKQSLDSEKALLTKELIEEREEEIAYQEKELMDYQMKRFGPTGDLISQKTVLVKPIQDQVFNIIQDLAEARKYDFVFDKSSDLTMLFSAKRHDISDHVVNLLTRASRQQQLSAKELKRLEEADAKADLESDPEYQERQQKLEDRKAQREKMLEERRAAQEAKRKEYEEKRAKLLEEREAKRNGRNNSTPAPDKATDTEGDDTPPAQNRPAATTPAPKSANDKPVQGENSTEVKTTATDKPEAGDAETVQKQNTQAERQRILEERKQAAEERRQKILAEREAARQAREAANNKPVETEVKTETTTDPADPNSPDE